MRKDQTHRQFILFIAVFQAVVIALFCIFVRYDKPLDSLHHENRTMGTKDSVMDSQYHSEFFIAINAYWHDFDDNFAYFAPFLQFFIVEYKRYKN